MQFYQEFYDKYRAYLMRDRYNPNYRFMRVFDLEGRHIVDCRADENPRVYLNDIARGFRLPRYLMTRRQYV